MVSELLCDPLSINKRFTAARHSATGVQRDEVGRADRLLQADPGLNLKMHTASCGRGGSDVNSCGAGPPGSLLHISSVQAAFLGLVPRMCVNIGRCFTRRRRLWFFHVYPNLPASREDPSASQSRQGGMNTKAKENRTLAAFVCASPMVCPARPHLEYLV